MLAVWLSSRLLIQRFVTRRVAMAPTPAVGCSQKIHTLLYRPFRRFLLPNFQVSYQSVTLFASRETFLHGWLKFRVAPNFFAQQLLLVGILESSTEWKWGDAKSIKNRSADLFIIPSVNDVLRISTESFVQNFRRIEILRERQATKNVVQLLKYSYAFYTMVAGTNRFPDVTSWRRCNPNHSLDWISDLRFLLGVIILPSKPWRLSIALSLIDQRCTHYGYNCCWKDSYKTASETMSIEECGSIAKTKGSKDALGITWPLPSANEGRVHFWGLCCHRERFGVGRACFLF